MIQWYDKLAFTGIVVCAVGAVMFIAGLWFAIDANRQARADFRASLQQARQELNNPKK